MSASTRARAPDQYEFMKEDSDERAAGGGIPRSEI